MKQKRNYFNMNDSGVSYFFYLIVSLLLSSVVSAICRNYNFNQYTNEYYSIVLLAVNQMAMLIAFFGYTAMAKINFASAMNLKKAPSIKQTCTLFFVALSAIVAFLPIAYLFMYLLGLGGFKSTGNIYIPQTVGGFFAGLAFAVIMPAVLEEFIYRGLLMGGLKQKSYAFAVMMTSLIFCLSHGSAEQTVHQLLASIVICLVVLYGGSVWFGVIVHFFNNLISLVMSFVPIDFAPLGYFNILLGVGCFVLGMLLLIVFMKLFKQQCKDRCLGEKIVNVYPKGKFMYVINGVFDTITRFFRGIVSSEDRKKSMENFEETIGYLDDDYVKNESVMGKEKGVSIIIIGIVVILVIMWIVSLVQGF